MKIAEREINLLQEKVIKLYPLINFVDYETVFASIVLEIAKESKDLKDLYQKLKEYFEPINKLSSIEVINSYLASSFNYNVKSASELCRELNKFLMFALKKDIILDLSFCDDILKENPKFATIIKNILAPSNTINPEYLESLVKTPELRDLLDAILAILNIEIVEEEEQSDDNKKKGILPKSEILRLFEEYHNGNLDAREKVLNSNILLVKKIANGFHAANLTYDDLFQIGFEGLMEAFDRFDYNRGFSFSTYATYWIRQRITREIDNFDRNVRIPVNKLEEIKKIYAIKNTLENALLRKVTNEELAAETGKTLEEINLLLNYMPTTKSLSEAVGEHEDTELGELVASDYDLEQETLNKMSAEDVDKVLEVLDDREREIIKRRSGYGYDHKYSLEEVGEVLHITRERVRQIEKKAKSKLLKFLKKDDNNKRKISENKIKMQFNHYFMLVDLSILREKVSLLSSDYQRIIKNLYDKNFNLQKNIYYTTADLDIFYEEIIPTLFKNIYEIDEEDHIIPFITYFPKLALKQIRTIKTPRFDLIWKRYGDNLDSLNPLNKEELANLYIIQIPRFYNYYEKKYRNKIIKSLKVRFNFLPVAELKKVLEELPAEEQEEANKLYGPALNEVNMLYYDEALESKIIALVNSYVKNKNANESSECVVISKAKSFREKYAQYDLAFLKELINTLEEKEVFYIRYGENLDKLNRIDSYTRSKLNEGLKKFEALLEKSREEKEAMTRNIPLTVKYNKTFAELNEYLKKLTDLEQNLLKEVYGPFLDTYNGISKEKVKLLTNTLKRLDNVLNSKKIKSICQTIEKPKPLIARYNLSLETLKDCVNKTNNPSLIYHAFGPNLDEIFEIPLCREKDLLSVLAELDTIIANNKAPEEVKPEASKNARRKRQGKYLKEYLPDKTLEFIQECTKNLPYTPYRDVLYEVYGKNLDEYYSPSKEKRDLLCHARASLINFASIYGTAKFFELSKKKKLLIDHFPDKTLEFIQECTKNLPYIPYRDILYEVYGKNLDEYHSPSKERRDLLYHARASLIKFASIYGTPKYLNHSKKAKLLMEYFPDKTIEFIRECTQNLPNLKNQNILYEVYGEKLDEYHSPSKEKRDLLCYARNSLIKFASIYGTPKYLNHSKKAKLLMEYFPDKTIEFIRECTANLPNLKNQNILYEVYGKNLDEYYSPSKEKRDLLCHARNSLIKFAPIYEKDKSLAFLKKGKNLSEYLPNKSLEEIKAFIETLKNSKYRDILYEVYGKNLDEYHSPSKENLKLLCHAREALIRSIERDKNNNVPPVEVHSIEGIEPGTSPLPIEEKLKVLPAKHYFIYCLKEGIIWKKCSSYQIANMFGIEELDVDTLYAESLEMLRSLKGITLSLVKKS